MSVEYVTIDEFNKFKEELLNGKQYIWGDTGKHASGRPNAASSEDTKYSIAGKQSTADAAKSD